MKQLFEAIKNNNIDKVKLLLSQGNVANALNEDNSTPLMIAIKHERVEIAKILLESGSDISSRDKK